MAEIFPGQSPAGSALNENGDGMPFYQGSRDFGGRHPSRRVYTTHPIRTAEAGDILLSVRAPMGVVNIASEKCSIGRGVMALRARPGYSAAFLFHLLRRLEPEWERHGSAGSVFSNLGKSDLARVRVSAPDNATQNAIGEVLDALDCKSDHNRQLAQRASDSIEAALGAVETEERPLSELVAFENNRRVPLSKSERQARLGAYPYYGATGVLDHIDGFLFEGVRVLVGEDGSVVSADGAPVVQLVTDRFWVSNHAHVLTGSGISTELLATCLRSSRVRHLVTGSVQPKLSKSNLSRLVIRVPTDAAKENLEMAAEDAFSLSWALLKEADGLDRLAEAIRPGLLTGELVVEELAA
jgi:type I restriction enzyme S subunit